MSKLYIQIILHTLQALHSLPLFILFQSNLLTGSSEACVNGNGSTMGLFVCRRPQNSMVYQHVSKQNLQFLGKFIFGQTQFRDSMVKSFLFCSDPEFLFTHPHSVPHESSGSGLPSIPVDLISSSSSTSWKDSGPSHLRQEGLGVMTSGYVLMYVYKCEYKFNKSKHIHVHVHMRITYTSTNT